MVAVALANALGNYRVATRTGRWRELEAKRRGILLVDLHQFQLLEHFYARLHLQRLGVGSLKALDELHVVGNHLLLVVVLLLLLLATLLAQLEVFRVVYLVVVDATHGYLDGAGGDVVDKSPIVADDDYRLGAVDEELLEPLDRLDVHVVGGLVEQDEVGLLQQNLGQLDAHAPSAAEVAGWTGEVLANEAQAEQDLLHLGIVVDILDGVELLAEG